MNNFRKNNYKPPKTENKSFKYLFNVTTVVERVEHGQGMF